MYHGGRRSVFVAVPKAADFAIGPVTDTEVQGVKWMLRHLGNVRQSLCERSHAYTHDSGRIGKVAFSRAGNECRLSPASLKFVLTSNENLA